MIVVNVVEKICSLKWGKKLKTLRRSYGNLVGYRKKIKPRFFAIPTFGQ